MVLITRELIFKKSEHNEDGMRNLEEIALHQLQIEKIETIGSLCPKLKILLLQENIITRIENLHRLKNLVELNLGMNNITLIEGLEKCESLRKLDLMLNFIKIQDLDQSLNNLKSNYNLEELMLMGNPCCDWEDSREFVILKLPTLSRFNLKAITPTERLISQNKHQQLFNSLEKSIALEEQKKEVVNINPLETDLTSHNPQTRTQIYREMGDQIAEKEEYAKKRFGKERNFEEEHLRAVEESRKNPYFEDGRVKQCNEAELKFSIEEDRENYFLTLYVAKHLDSSLINCELFPDFVSVVVKNKIFRFAYPAKVQSSLSKCERSLTSGELLITAVKTSTTEEEIYVKKGASFIKVQEVNKGPNNRTKRLLSKPSPIEEMMAVAMKS